MDEMIKAAAKSCKGKTERVFSAVEYKRAVSSRHGPFSSINM